MSSIRLLLVDDQELFLESLRTVIERSTEDLSVVGVARNGEEAIAAVRSLEPDLVIMDVRMPVMDGVQATRAIMELYPETRIMMLTTFGDDEYVKEALEHGASSYVLKGLPPAEIITAIRAVAAGAFLIAPSVAKNLIRKAYKNEGMSYAEEPEWVGKLSRRELEILDRLARGLSNKEIAAELFIAEPTVRNHVSVIYDKMGAANRAEAARMARRASTKS